MNPLRSNSQRHDSPIAIDAADRRHEVQRPVDVDPAQLAVDDDREADRQHDQDRRDDQVDE